MRAGLGIAQLVPHGPLDIVGDGVLPGLGLVVHLDPGQAQHLAQETFGETVTPHDYLGQVPALVGQVYLVSYGDEPVGLHPVHHLRHRGPAHPQPIGDAGLNDREVGFMQLEDGGGVFSIGSAILAGPVHTGNDRRGVLGWTGREADSVRPGPAHPQCQVSQYEEAGRQHGVNGLEGQRLVAAPDRDQGSNPQNHGPGREQGQNPALYPTSMGPEDDACRRQADDQRTADPRPVGQVALFGIGEEPDPSSPGQQGPERRWRWRARFATTPADRRRASMDP